MHQEEQIRALREFLKDDVRKRTDFSQTDQTLGVQMPPVQQPVKEGALVLPLPEWRGVVQPQGGLDELIGTRRSLRKYADQALSAEEVSFLFWATQGVRSASEHRVVRTVPSAGNRHSAEAYAAFTRAVENAAGEVLFEPGIWRYLPLSHSLTLVSRPEGLNGLVSEAALMQEFVGKAPVTFFWTSRPYRTEWRYAQASHKVIALDFGHICQNLYLACGAIGCGTCAVAAYDQQAADRLLSVDGQEEMVVYLAPVGKNPYLK